MGIRLILTSFLFGSTAGIASGVLDPATASTRPGVVVSIRDFGVSPTNSPAANRQRLQKAIDWASPRGAALFVEPSEDPYPVDGGLILKKNVSLVGVHGPTGRGTRHPEKEQPVGSVFSIVDESVPFITVESATQLKGLQFWYPRQTISDPSKIIPYPATIQMSRTSSSEGVTLSCLTFYGEYLAMDFNGIDFGCEQILFEHCYGYPLGGEFIRINKCWDIPRILHCHVNPSNQRFIKGGFSAAVIDSVIAKKKFTYAIDNTDNAVLMDVFTFGNYGGIYLGPKSYGQLTGFNLDCVTVGIHKKGDNNFNRGWQIAQGSIIANTGAVAADIHPMIIEGQGHTAISNVEAFSGGNTALTCVGTSQDFLAVRGNKKLTVTLAGCSMRNYRAASPLTIENPNAVIQAVGCWDKNEEPFDWAVRRGK